jgi:hypothetical protein
MEGSNPKLRDLVRVILSHLLDVFVLVRLSRLRTHLQVLL